MPACPQGVARPIRWPGTLLGRPLSAASPVLARAVEPVGDKGILVILTPSWPPGLLRLSPTGFEPVGRAIENSKQDALLPSIALISHRFVVLPYPVSPRHVPFSSPLEGHTGGTCGPIGATRSRTRSARVPQSRASNRLAHLSSPLRGVRWSPGSARQKGDAGQMYSCACRGSVREALVGC